MWRRHGHHRGLQPIEKPSTRTRIATHPAKKSTTPVSRLYIAPAILTAPWASMSASAGLSRRILSITSSTFLRATASTNAEFVDVLSPAYVVAATAGLILAN